VERWKSVILKFRGPCTVYTQSRNPQDLKRMQEFAKNKQNQQEGGGSGDNGAANAN